MATPTTPKTLLDAVNELLRAIRLARVMSLNAANMNEAASSAKEALEIACLEIQAPGWEFNQTKAVTLDPNEAGEILLPSNCLKVRTARDGYGERLVQRGQRLYSRKKQSFAIGEAVKVDIVEALDYDDLSQAFRMWVTALAARRFCIPRMPSGATFQYTEDFLEAAIAAAHMEDSEVNDDTLKDSSPHFFKMGRR